MARRVTPDDRLDGWEAISHYLGWTPRTVIRWEKQKGLPVHRLAGGKRQPVYAYRREIDRWFQKTGGGATVAILEPPNSDQETASVSFTSPHLTSGFSRRAIQAIVAVIALMAVVLSAAWRMTTQPVMQITGVTQLTDDGAAKHNLVTDGKQLYFSEEVGDEVVLSTMAVTGGPIRQISLTLPNPRPEDISSDGKLLLVLSSAGYESERSLWVVPTSGGNPYEIDGIKCHSAAWSPNAEWIALGFGNAIYLISRDGAHTRQVAKLDGIPETIRWSEDGKHLLYFLRTLREDTVSLWQMNLDSSFNADPARPFPIDAKNLGRDGSLARAANGYFTVSTDSTADLLLHFRPRHWWRGKSFEVSALSTRFDAIEGLATDAGGSKLFLLNGAHEQSELVRYDLSKRSFTLMLPGATATHVDLTKNMQMAAYVKSQDGTLWASAADGSDARQLSPVGMDTELPRWSPDGKWIAFMGKRADRPWRIYVVAAAGGDSKETSEGNDNQGAPTWSPDGRFLAYGNVLCQEEHACAIHKIDLASGRVTTIPDSQGLGTARWSPDGKYIAALNPVEHELYVFDLDRQKWHKLADGINGNDVSWSSDSQYANTKSSINGQTEILRVPVSGGSVQAVLNLNSFSKSLGQLDTWFSLTPDNALMLNRWLNTSEIYALSYQEH